MNNASRDYAFIFDMDGTLIDDMPFHNQVWVKFLAEKGAKVNPGTFHNQTAGKTNPEIFRLFLGESISDSIIQTYSVEKEIRYRDAYRNHIEPIGGLMEFLESTQKAGIKMGLATAAGPENINFVLKQLGLQGCFQTSVNGEEIQRGKPDPEIFLKAAERLNIAADRCLVFEDSRGGIEAARRAGMPVIVITTGMPADEALSIPGVRLAVPDYTSLDPNLLAK